MRRRLGARRAIGLGLLIPGLLLTHPTASAAESKPSKPQQKRPEPTPRTAQGSVTGDEGSRDATSHCLHVVHSGDSISRSLSATVSGGTRSWPPTTWPIRTG